MYLYDEIKDTVNEYLIYLERGGKRIVLPEHIHDETLSKGKIHASALGRCPLAKSIERNRPRVESEESKHSFASLYLMQGGVRDAELYQEAFLWKHPNTAQVEFSIDGFGMRGRMDIYYDGHVIEIKSRHVASKDAPPMMFLGDAYQTLAYGLILNVQPPKTLNTLLRTRFGFTLYTFKPEGNGFTAYDQHGKRWFPDYNRPEFLSYPVVQSLAEKHLKYLQGELTHDPMPNYLNTDGGRECGYWKDDDRPKRFKQPFRDQNGKTVQFIPTCPFWCHHASKPDYVEVEEIDFGSKKYQELKREPVETDIVEPGIQPIGIA